MSWKNQTDKKLTELHKIAQAIYVLSNSHMSKQLGLNVVVTSRLAEITGKQADIDQARLSKKWYDEHRERERRVEEARIGEQPEVQVLADNTAKPSRL
jgi:hypothetical protein